MAWFAVAALVAAIGAALTAGCTAGDAVVESARRPGGSEIAAKSYFQRFALNFIVAPLLDDSAHPRWVHPSFAMVCDGGSSVLVDGVALVEGAPLPSRPFVLRWSMRHCGLLGEPTLDMDGDIDLHVTTVDGVLIALAEAHHLQVRTSQGTAILSDSFTGRLSIGGSEPLPGGRMATLSAP